MQKFTPAIVLGVGALSVISCISFGGQPSLFNFGVMLWMLGVQIIVTLGSCAAGDLVK